MPIRPDSPQLRRVPTGTPCGVLHELRVENLLLIERAELSPGPSLNALTGETGAGKTVLAHALDLLLGGKPRSASCRPGASEAYVKGVFGLPAALRESLADRLPEGEDELVLARRVSAEGRTRAYVGGRSATAGDLAEIGGALLSFYGQHEHRRLTLASAQLDILDGFAGTEQSARRDEFALAYARERAACEELEALRLRTGARDRDSTCWSGELEEIDRAEPSEAEEQSLLAEREKLRHLAALLGRGRRSRRGAQGRRVVARRLRCVRRRRTRPRGRGLRARGHPRRRRGARRRDRPRLRRSPSRRTIWPQSCGGTARASTRHPAGSSRSRSGSPCSTG